MSVLHWQAGLGSTHLLIQFLLPQKGLVGAEHLACGLNVEHLHRGDEGQDLELGQARSSRTCPTESRIGAVCSGKAGNTSHIR